MPASNGVNVTIEDGTTVLEPRGPLDGPTARVLAELVRIAAGSGAGVVVDLRRLQPAQLDDPAASPPDRA